MITVYHIPQRLLGSFFDVRLGMGSAKTMTEWAKKNYPLYERVAHLNTSVPEVAFELTNSIDAHWSENKGIVELFVPRARSTSVGDILVIDNTKRIMVAPIGFTELD